MKTNVSIKFSTIKEYREIEKKLEELGYVNDKCYNELMFNRLILNKHIKNTSLKIFIGEYEFIIDSIKDDYKVYNSLEEFLKD